MTDSELLHRSQAGDASARDDLARRWLGRLYGVCLAVTGNRADAEDAVQDAMLKAFGTRASLRDPERLGPWLVRIARNAALDLLRQRQRRERPRTVPETLTHPDGDGQLRIDGARAWALLEEQERLVVWWVLVGEHTFAEIALWTGTSKSAVHRRWAAALHRLKKEGAKC